jgi:NDP-sugar pyrophosphorylase family protein
MAAVANREPLKYGGLVVSPDGAVTGFARRGAAAEGSCHFIGVQIARADVFRSVPVNRPANSIGDVYDGLLATHPGSIRAYRCDAAFQDIGTTSDYWATTFACIGSRSPDEVYGQRVHVGSGARVTRSILWDDIEVGADAVIEDCIVTDGVQIPARSVHRRSVLRRGDQGLLVTPL